MRHRGDAGGDARAPAAGGARTHRQRCERAGAVGDRVDRPRFAARRGRRRAARRRRVTVRAAENASAPGRDRSRRGGRSVIRPRSKERALRTAVLVTGDSLIGWGALYAVVELRRHVGVAFTRTLLPPAKFALDPPLVALFVLALIAALALS